MATHQVLWLRNDLRLHDHQGFRMAHLAGLPLTVVYILPSHWVARDHQGLNRLGNAKATFLRACLIDLQRTLSDHNLTLHILSGDPVALLTDLLGQHGELLTSEAQAPEEQTWLARLNQTHRLRTYTSQTLYNRFQLEPLLHDWPVSFSRFRRWLQKQPQPLIAQDEESPEINLTDHPVHTRAPVHWPDQPGADIRLPLNGGERVARQHLQDYLWRSRAVGHYRQTRNRLLGPNSSSLFSAHLAWGALSVREIWRQLDAWKSLNSENPSVRALRDELLWREYFHWSLVVNGSRLFQHQGLRDKPPETGHNEDFWQAWCHARTGIPGIDAGLKELVRTGFVSNRLRQNMASYFVHELKLDWRLGARWFEQHLIDADPGSNYGNWAYIAGVGHNPRPCHRFHLNQQLEHYDPELNHLRHWLPELGSHTSEHILMHQSGEYSLTDYASPIVAIPESSDLRT